MFETKERENLRLSGITILLLPILRPQFLLPRFLPILPPSFSPPIWVWAPNNTHAWFFKDFHTTVDEDNAEGTLNVLGFRQEAQVKQIRALWRCGNVWVRIANR